MMRHAAVWIFFEARSAALGPETMPAFRGSADAADEWPRFGSGRERWRATWERRENMGLLRAAAWEGRMRMRENGRRIQQPTRFARFARFPG